MSTIERILVPVHFRADVGGRFVVAADSIEAVEHAAEIAVAFGSKITFAHAFAGREAPGASSDDGDLPSVRAALQGLVDRQAERGIEARWLFLFGMPWREIASLASTENYDLVVIGTRQRPGQGRLVGSTAAAVLASCSRPVLVAKHGGRLGGRIVVATDLSPMDDPVVGFASSLAVRTNAELHVVHACQPPAEDLESTAREMRVRRAKLECEVARVVGDAQPQTYANHVEVGSPTHVIWSFAQRVDAGLVVVGQHDHSLFERTLRGATAELFAELPCSLIRVRA